MTAALVTAFTGLRIQCKQLTVIWAMGDYWIENGIRPGSLEITIWYFLHQHPILRSGKVQHDNSLQVDCAALYSNICTPEYEAALVVAEEIEFMFDSGLW